MKKLILSFLLVCLSVAGFSQTVDLYATGTSGSYTTGSATGTTRTDDAIISTSTTQNGYAVFDLSTIPAGSIITSSTLLFYVSSYTAGVAAACNTYGFAGDLSTVTTPATLFSDITGGSLLFSAVPPMPGSYGSMVGYDSISADSPSHVANVFLQANIGSKISIGFTGGGTNVYTITGETATPGYAPILRISYAPPCAGAPSAGYIMASVLEACTTSTVTLTDPWAPTAPGITFQWQSSPDSATWTNIPGATAATYSFTGLAATTFYRHLAICSFSGLSSSPAGTKISYITTCCTGTPPVGVTTPSTTYCSACSLTLTLSGYAVAAGISYQWQISSDNTTWGPLYGATSTSYTFSPFGAYYYRCKTSCSYSGFSSYSSSVFVGYQYHIIANSVTPPASNSCDPPIFNVAVNGSSAELYMKTYYGDGSIDSIALINDTATSHLNTPHNYATSGTYTVKQVLYYANTPQDSITEYYAAHHCDVLPLSFYIDANNNCLKEFDELYNGLPVRVKIDSSGVPVDTVSATSGFYYIAQGPVGTIYSFSVLSAPGAVFVSCPSSGIVYDTIHFLNETYQTKSIAFNCVSPLSFDLGLYTVNVFTRGQHQGTWIYAFNSQCEPADATVTVYFSPKYDFSGGYATPAPSSISGNSLTWNLYGLSSVSTVTGIFYRVENSPVTGHLYEGDTVHSMYAITPTTGDINLSDNSEMVIDSVTSSWDPNEISVTPSGCISSDTDGTVLQYTIHFTNVGNDTAFNIYVMDTLSDNVDPKSLQILMASNTMNIAIFNDGTHNIAKFDFPNINLQDTTACPTCMGAVIYDIKTRQSLPEGATIFNRASIYFDDNPAVMTNTVEDVKGGCFPNAVNGLKQESDYVRILPNPATDELNVQLGNLSTYQTFTITNSIGQQITQQPLTQPKTKVDISKFPAGLYYITFRGDNGTEVRKFVKL